jgi:hypothetical protein
MTRLWVDGVVIRVWCTPDGRPMRVRWQGQSHDVKMIANGWRLDLGWWRLRIWRDYYKILTTTGLLMIVYHDLMTDIWYLQRVYD